MDALLAQAYNHLKENRLKEASDLARNLLDQRPRDHKNWALLRDINIRANRHEQAIYAANRAVEFGEDKVNSLLELTRVLINAGCQSDALETLNKIDAKNPDSARINDTLGTLYAMCDEPARGLPYSQAAVSASPDNPAYLSNLAMIQRMIGDLSSAENNFDRAISLNPHDYRSYYSRSDLQTWTHEKNHILRIESLLKATIKDWRGEVAVRFALAKEYEDLEDYDKAFKALEGANRLQRRHTRYNVTDDVEVMDHIVRTHTRNALEKLPIGFSSEEPIFVLGLPRSGTTLVERILSCHSRVYAAGELNNFAMQLTQSSRQQFGEKPLPKTELVEKALHLGFQKLGHDYVKSTRPRTGHTPHFIDKLPMNYLYCGLIHAALPDAKIILLERNPMDSCFGMYRMMFLNAYPFSYSLDDIGAYYLAWRRLVNHWKNVLGNRLHIINYEKLTQDPETQIRLLLNHCDLPWEDDCLEFHKNAAPSTTASAVQVRQKIYTSSVEKWKKYEKQLTSLHRFLREQAVPPLEDA
jgi:cytochrome c-type biogenesis protein CcmH/NrfG